MREADQILVLKDGNIAERGNHQELMARPGLYRDIYELQLRPQEEVLLDAALSGIPARAATAAAAGADGGDN